MPAASLRLPRHLHRLLAPAAARGHRVARQASDAAMPSGSGWRSATSSRSGATTSPRNGESGHFATDVASGVATRNYIQNYNHETTRNLRKVISE